MAFALKSATDQIHDLERIISNLTTDPIFLHKLSGENSEHRDDASELQDTLVQLNGAMDDLQHTIDSIEEFINAKMEEICD